MHEAQTPQQALDIAAATTRQAQEAAALPSGGPFAAGVFAAVFSTMLGLTTVFDFDDPITWAAAAGAVASGLMCFATVRWLRRVRRARGLVPVPLAQWKFTVILVVVLVVPVFGFGNPSVAVGLQVVAGVILGGWVWFEQARPQGMPWKTRRRIASWRS
ncbi:hypothetical protein [Nocardia sp. NBC_01327]|uniref:hypothetical protein n=1 Tax=Nocardia sp. NBC_01327 TaxID=2903593 RepID=UPI002E128E13|nr:hypothetical protein OG326_01070 [Nocardia sp. NBC_01327]